MCGPYVETPADRVYNAREAIASNNRIIAASNRRRIIVNESAHDSLLKWSQEEGRVLEPLPPSHSLRSSPASLVAGHAAAVDNGLMLGVVGLQRLDGPVVVKPKPAKKKAKAKKKPAVKRKSK